MKTQKIGFLLYDGVNTLDLAGPLEAFNAVKSVSMSPYTIHFIALEQGTIQTESGLPIVADTDMTSVNALDTLIIPGGKGARDTQMQALLCPWLKNIRPQVKRLVSVCTGAFLLAKTGLLNGRKATTHWAFVDEFKREFPSIQLNAASLFIDHGDIATSAGITAGVDMTLKLIEDDLGSNVASRVARYLVVHYRRSGDQTQFSIPLQLQEKADKGFASLTGWVMSNLQKDLSVGQLADFCGMSERHFCRRFSERMDVTPARYVEILRLDYARQLLVEKSWQVGQVAHLSGYQNATVFRRAFERRFGVTPKAYRQTFRDH